MAAALTEIGSDNDFAWTAANPVRKKSVAHRFGLACVWLAVASGIIVFSEPAPIDALIFGLFILLPTIGLFVSKRAIAALSVVWLIISASTLISCFVARDAAISTLHTLVTFYLYGACILFAGFIAKSPYSHTRLVLHAYFLSAVFAAALGIAGYFDLFPGAFELLTRFGRASGTFKDPNVFAPYLIPGLLIALHLFLVRPVSKSALPLAAAVVITLALLFSFSRGAWAATGIALGIYCYFYLHSAERSAAQLKLAALVLFGTVVVGLALAAASQADGIARLLEERAAITQPYDEGPEGRFGGQLKAAQLILENPLGIGAQTFTTFYHHEEAHNVYLSVLMSAGWLGGALFLLVCAGTLAIGFQHALKRTKTQPYFIIVYAALTGIIIEGCLIDTDHWRHFYLLLGIVWGLIAGDNRPVRKARIVRDVTPVLKRKLLIVPAPTRGNRIVGRTTRTWNVAELAISGPQSLADRRRASRIIAPVARRS